MPHRWLTSKHIDSALVESIREIKANWPEVRGGLHLLSDTYHDLAEVLNEDSEIGSLLAGSNNCLIVVLNLNFGGLAFTMERGDRNGNAHPTVMDFVVASPEATRPGDEPNRARALAAAQEIWPPVIFPAVTGSAVDPTASIEGAIAIQHKGVEELRTVATQVLRETTEFRQQLERESREREAQRSYEHQQALETLQREFNEKLSELAQQREAVETEKRQLDDRHNTHARRDIRNQLLSDVRDRTAEFKLSTDTVRKREAVARGIIGLILFLGGTALTALMIEYLHSGGVRPLPDSDKYWLWARASLALFGTVATLVYYTKWADRWARRHEDAELQLRQFQIDINRASWVVESCLEWRKSTNTDVPPDLLKTISQGLFASQGGTQEPVVHPADALASALLGSASKLKLKAGESELEINKPAKSIPASVGAGEGSPKS